MQWLLFGPELYFFLAVVVFTIMAMRPASGSRHEYFTALVLAALGMVVCLAGVRSDGVLFSGTYRVDLYSQVFKTMLSMGLFLVVCICTNLGGVNRKFHPEFYLLLFTSTLAMMMLVSAVHLLTIYVALELSSYSLYILVALQRRQEIGLEATLKYFLVGVCASAVMLFGLAVLYGSVKAVYLSELVQALPAVIDRPLVVIGLLLSLGGFFFKLAVFPFHFWAPDVYQGAPNQVAAFIASASKVAAVAILMRFVAVGSGGSTYVAQALVALAIVSMTVGNLAAVAQKDFNRLMAYSSIAHAGYVLIGILCMDAAGYTATIFYALSLMLMKFTCFLVLVKVAGGGGSLQIDQLAGLHRRSPLLAMALMLALFGLAGIPPTIGFTGKLLVFIAAMQQGYFTLVLIAMINVVISLYYYMLVIKAAYLLEPPNDLPALSVSPPVKLLTGTLVTAMVVIGVFPTYVIALARAAARFII
ncbi:MAG: NADH-quinone oxidoreductase subunit N [Desulfobacterales bacterium]|jgi:NADH-quinone oxidoreductase subunit N